MSSGDHSHSKLSYDSDLSVNFCRKVLTLQLRTFLTDKESQYALKDFCILYTESKRVTIITAKLICKRFHVHISLSNNGMLQHNNWNAGSNFCEMQSIPLHEDETRQMQVWFHSTISKILMLSWTDCEGK